MEFGTDCGLKKGCTVLGAEYQVDQVPCQGLGHDGVRCFALSGRMILWRSTHPGRCPGLSCYGPFRAKAASHASGRSRRKPQVTPRAIRAKAVSHASGQIRAKAQATPRRVK